MAPPRRLERYLRRKARQEGVPIREAATCVKSQPRKKGVVCYSRLLFHLIDGANDNKKPSRFNQQQSRLLSLPPELRNKIYQHALQAPDIIFIKHSSGLIPPAWINASKQLHNETYKMWYTINHFCLQIDDLDYTPFIGLPRFCDRNDLQLDLGITFSHSYA
ncbi:hypothetical protein LTR37_001952 [Vermiconidia calcicola]|uniref:Uncharacterized protein n=1 Tax=Vermiconidia calcicola TaxID=1690605 RepID=A0ACC3NUL9_9PEZI|nr:hypothetical protein LTR37_001952 [Vermiconidia calcicola]